MRNRTVAGINRLLAILAVFSIIAIVLTSCSSGDGSQAEKGFPAVTGKAGQKPSIAKGTGQPPKELKTRVLHKGDGHEVGKKDTVLASYTGQLWNGKVFDSTWENNRGPASFGLDQVIPGWKEGLAGKHVGDRVQLVIPPDKGYGDKENGPIPAGSTLVFVVDIKDSANMTDTSALASAKPLNPELGKGLSVAGKPGTKPELKISKEFKAATEFQVTVLNEGKGEPIQADDIVGYHITAQLVGKDGPKDSPQSSWEMGGIQNTQQSIGTNPNMMKLFLGQKIGSRVLVQMPAAKGAGGATQDARVVILDLTGKLATK